jgi:hypothetical protein
LGVVVEVGRTAAAVIMDRVVVVVDCVGEMHIQLLQDKHIQL